MEGPKMFSLMYSSCRNALVYRSMSCGAATVQYCMLSSDAKSGGVLSSASSHTNTASDSNADAFHEATQNRLPTSPTRTETFTQSYTIHKRSSIPSAKEQSLVQMWRETANDMGSKNVVEKYGATFKDTRVSDPNETTEVKRRRLYYQSQYRGMVEMDLILGHFARCKLHDLDPPLLSDYDTILKQYDSDLFNWLVMGQSIPEEIAGLACFKAVQDFIRSNRHELLGG